MNDKRKEKEQKTFLRVKDVMELCDISESRAYRVMQQLDEELASKGFITTAGRVPRKYLAERLNIQV